MPCCCKGLLRRKMVLSDRLEKIIEAVPRCKSVADIGCDHGYVSMELIRRGKADHAVAADVNEGPLSRAKKNIEDAGLSDRIEIVLSDGLLNISVTECIVISGMGGRLMRDILNFTPTTSGAYEKNTSSCSLSDCRCLILSPQSEPEILRSFIQEDLGFYIRDESMVKDMGKYYVIISAQNPKYMEAELYTGDRYIEDEDFIYGKRLIQKRDTVFLEYLRDRLKKDKMILLELEKNGQSEVSSERKKEILGRDEFIEKIL